MWSPSITTFGELYTFSNFSKFSNFYSTRRDMFNFVCLVDECPQDVIELIHVFGSISFTDVAD